MVIGVQDRPGGPAAIEGTSLDANLLLRRIYELTTPPLTVEVQQKSRGSVNLLVVRVPRSPDVHQVDNRATRRVGTSCEPMSATHRRCSPSVAGTIGRPRRPNVHSLR